MTRARKNKNEKFKVYIKPQSISDCFIATMDPKDPFKICLYPSTKSQTFNDGQPIGQSPDEPEDLILHNYLILKRNCLED